MIGVLPEVLGRPHDAADAGVAHAAGGARMLWLLLLWLKLRVLWSWKYLFYFIGVRTA